MTTTERTIAAARLATGSPYAGFGQALKNWLVRADRSQKELAHAIQVDPSTITNWIKGHKRPDARSLIRVLAAFRIWLGEDWDPREPLDAFACLGFDWFVVREVLMLHFEKGGLHRLSDDGGTMRVLPSARWSCRRGPSCMSLAALSKS